ncbi:hypothetical protein K437DRAFT_146178 [Tilletiaria anomala UBC 951]|uniref:Uncharacterized protein n=1 Tax=Tilletiaria anomala (strain ATCC 24038 / CBS 436.72 / UBC 951) TaxID=1037660 RepID=A0A066VPW0_TILAU|nr:uncharacterized protein K437DRAFT_146178 [Tilletiaria anomala UBC 951]KDN43777.1 hypothetical protein K437DRAFT_146178 [Tilletiaria anomala UBC 951]
MFFRLATSTAIPFLSWPAKVVSLRIHTAHLFGGGQQYPAFVYLSFSSLCLQPFFSGICSFDASKFLILFSFFLSPSSFDAIPRFFHADERLSCSHSSPANQQPLIV